MVTGITFNQAALYADTSASVAGESGPALAAGQGGAALESPQGSGPDKEAQPSGSPDAGEGAKDASASDLSPSPALPLAPAPSASPAGDSPGSIAGFVWADGNGSRATDWDGLYNGTEAALPGYTVYLYAADGPKTPLATATTGQNGAYVFAGLVPGSYVIGIAPATVGGSEYLLPLKATAGNKFVPDMASSPVRAYTDPIVLAAGQEVTGIDAGMRLPMAVQALAGNSYTIDFTYSVGGSLAATGRGYTFNSPKLTFDASSTGNDYTIIRSGSGAGSVASIEFAAGANPASITFNDVSLSGGITFGAGFDAPMTFNNVSLGSTTSPASLTLPAGYNADLSFNNLSLGAGSLTLPTGFDAALGINGLAVNKLALPSDYTDPITFNGITATGGIVYPAGYNEPITIASDFTVQAGGQFPSNYTAPLTIGDGTFTKSNLICRPGATVPSGTSGIFLPANITTITIKDAKTSGDGNLRLLLGSVDAGREFTLLVAGSSDFTGSIEAPVGTLLTIDSAAAPGTKSEEGTLKVTSNDYRAAIGGGTGSGSTGSSGQVTINGATVVATSSGGAGIGGGGSGSAGNVTINGGNVTASALGIPGTNVDINAAGIGGGVGGVGNVTINGGTVVAKSGDDTNILIGNGSGYGAAIGGGTDSYGNVTITGGYVSTTSIFGADIGNGGSKSGSPNGATQGNVTITGGTIRGYSLNGAAIGKGAGNGYVPTYEIDTEADILMYGRGFYQGRFGVQCTGENRGDGYYVSVFFDDRIRGDLYVCEASDTMSLVRVLPIDPAGIIYMSVTFSTGHDYPEDFKIFFDYYNDQGVYMGLRPIVHFYDHLPSGTSLTVKDPVIPSVTDMKSYPSNFQNSKDDVLYAYMDIGAVPPLFFRVTEKYVDTEGNPLTDPSNPPSNTKDDTVAFVNPGDPYSKAIPDVPGYKPCGYFIGSAFNPPTDAYTPGSSVTIDPMTESLTVYFVYTPSAASVDFSFYKVNEKGGPLAGVVFALYTCTNDDPQHVHDSLVEAGSCWGDPIDAATSGQDGLVSFTGLVPGDYMLVEAETLPGYQLPHGQWLVEVDKGASEPEITAHGSGGMLPPAFKAGTGDQDGSLLLPNYREMTMPQAGGAGVLALTVTGIALIGAAVLYLVLSGARKQGGKNRPVQANGGQ